MNLKIDLARGDALREKPDVYPAYHMNRRNWISVVLDDTLSDDEVAHLVRASFELT